MSSVKCSRHDAEMYEDIDRSGCSLERWLCPERGCTSILATEQLEAIHDQAFASDNGILLPGMTVIGEQE